MLADLAAPVGELADAAPKGLDRAGELRSLALDVGPDLIGAAPGRPCCCATHRLAGAADVDVGRAVQRVPAPSVSFVLRASSIARSGVGGAPAWTERKAK